jgi:hypothetical protein
MPPRTPRASRPQPFAPPPHGQYRAAAGIGNGTRLSWVGKLMLRGVRGELIQEPWFQSMRQQNPRELLLGSFFGCILITFMLGFISPGTGISALFLDFVIDAIRIALCYVCLAVGTRLAHKLLFWGCVGSVIGTLIGMMIVVPAILLVGGIYGTLGIAGAPLVLLWALIAYGVVMVVVYTYLAVLVHRGRKQLARVVLR